jgi:4a-hydroxytetrahydrobiopterin dehydratase
MAALTDPEIEQRLARVEGWRRSDGSSTDGSSLSGDDAIVREWKLADFAAAIAFVDRVAEAAEAANHHPDILVHGWNRVRLTLSTHSQGGLTDADFSLAAEIDGLA